MPQLSCFKTQFYDETLIYMVLNITRKMMNEFHMINEYIVFKYYKFKKVTFCRNVKIVCVAASSKNCLFFRCYILYNSMKFASIFQSKDNSLQYIFFLCLVWRNNTSSCNRNVKMSKADIFLSLPSNFLIVQLMRLHIFALKCCNSKHNVRIRLNQYSIFIVLHEVLLQLIYSFFIRQLMTMDKAILILYTKIVKM